MDQVDIWFTRFQELVILADLPEKHWATKVTEFLDADSIKTVFSLPEDQRKNYEAVRNAILNRYNYTHGGNRLRYMTYAPTQQQNSLNMLQMYILIVYMYSLVVLS